MALDVSEDTIRRDLNELALEGRVVKVHGALSKSYQMAAVQTDTYAYEKKEVIAMKTLKLFKDGMVILQVEALPCVKSPSVYQNLYR
jgi:DeoR/GlpR family transcriptional regulator of sugar metabolism